MTTRMITAAREALLAPLRTAPDIASLEAALQTALDVRRLAAPVERTLLRTVEARGWELVTAHPQGERIPRLVRKPRSYRATYLGQTFHGSICGNGAALRGERVGLRQWVQAVGPCADAHLVRSIVDWILSGYPHRALASLLAAQADTTNERNEKEDL